MKTEEPEIHLNESTHEYFHESGRQLISVTRAFELVGITDYSRIPFEKLEPARLRGTLVHDIAMFYGQGMLDESSIDPSLMGYFDAIKRFYREEVGQVLDIERIVHNLKFGYAGMLDLLYLNRSHLLCLADFKTPITPHKANRWQTGAYAWAHPDRDKIRRRHAVMLRLDGTYEFDEHSNPLRRDFDSFLTILKCAVLKIENKIK